MRSHSAAHNDRPRVKKIITKKGKKKSKKIKRPRKRTGKRKKNVNYLRKKANNSQQLCHPG
jgi:hypothetical protein